MSNLNKSSNEIVSMILRVVTLHTFVSFSSLLTSLTYVCSGGQQLSIKGLTEDFFLFLPMLCKWTQLHWLYHALQFRSVSRIISRDSSCIFGWIQHRIDFRKVWQRLIQTNENGLLFSLKTQTMVINHQKSVQFVYFLMCVHLKYKITPSSSL